MADASRQMADQDLFARAVEEARQRGVCVADPTPPVSRTCLVNGLGLHVLDWQGAGRPPMLLLHGVLLNAHVWDLFSLDVRRHVHVYALDLPGHGDSQWAADGDYSRERMAAAVVGLIEHLDLTSLVLVGHSLGGSIAALVAARVPDRLQALVLVDSTLLPSGRPSVRARAAVGPHTFASSDDFTRYVERLGRRRDAARLALSLRWNARQQADGRWTWKYDPALRRVPPGPAATDFESIWAALHAFGRPVLFVRAGERSHLSDEAAQRLASLPNVRLVMVPAAGHNVMGDNPLAFRRAVAEFLTSLGAAIGA